MLNRQWSKTALVSFWPISGLPKKPFFIIEIIFSGSNEPNHIVHFYASPERTCEAFCWAKGPDYRILYYYKEKLLYLYEYRYIFTPLSFTSTPIFIYFFSNQREFVRVKSILIQLILFLFVAFLPVAF